MWTYLLTSGFNTQPPEGGWTTGVIPLFLSGFQHTAARRRLAVSMTRTRRNVLFQHTAARRRLPQPSNNRNGVSGFNTQPPEGGCSWPQYLLDRVDVSTHSRPKAADNILANYKYRQAFQHTAARRRLIVLSTSPFRVFCFNTQPPEGG